MESNHATIVTDLGFGDAGKGSMVDYLARQGRVAAVVRFNGGAQAAHNVVTPDGRHHTFHQFGSGSFVPGVRTHLSRFMLVDVFALMGEIEDLHRAGCLTVSDRLTIDEEAMVVTPFHKAANRMREFLRGADSHGTCGMGIGEAMLMSLNRPELVIRVRDLGNLRGLLKKMNAIQESLYSTFERLFHDLPEERHGRVVLNSIIESCGVKSAAVNAHGLWQCAKILNVVGGEYLSTLSKQGNLIFEGAQGVLLDEWHGFHPYTTWSTTTPANAQMLLREIGYTDPIKKLGVLRTYAVRHGAGPFPTEDEKIDFKEAHNDDVGAQGKFRRGWFDLVLSKYAMDVCGGIDELAITHMDAFSRMAGWQVGSSYEDAHGRLEKITPKRHLIDLAWQEGLTSKMFSVRPCYEKPPKSYDKDPGKYIGMIEDSLKVPITLTSWGPKAGDKRVRIKMKFIA